MRCCPRPGDFAMSVMGHFFFYQDVAPLDIAMGDAIGVEVAQPGQHLVQQRGHPNFKHAPHFKS